MNHQPFENWIYEEEILNTAQRKSLEQHLEECKECRSSHRAWLSLRDEMTPFKMASAKPGLSQRWLGSLAQRRLAEERRQGKRFALFLLGAAGLSLILVVSLAVLDQTPLDWIIGNLHTLALTVTRLKRLQMIGYSIFKSLPPFMPVIGWIVLTLPMGLLSLTWVGAIWQVSTQGVREK